MAKTKDLQKFTKTELKIKRILDKSPISKSDFEQLTDAEKEVFSLQVHSRLSTLKGKERDRFINEIENVSDITFRRHIWENNHNHITQTIENYVLSYGVFPSITHIATMTGLSRTTVHKHFTEFKESDFFKEHTLKYKIMTDRVIGNVLQCALKGNISASRLYLDFISNTAKNIGTQNNYIQINGVIFTDEKLKTLSPGQLKEIESILTNVEVNPIENL